MVWKILLLVALAIVFTFIIIRYAKNIEGGDDKGTKKPVKPKKTNYKPASGKGKTDATHRAADDPSIDLDEVDLSRDILTGDRLQD